MSDIRQRTVEAYLRNGGNISAAAREIGRHPSTVREHIRKAGIEKPVTSGRLDHPEPARAPLGRTYLLTCAQNNTPVHGPFWANLVALAEDRDATLLVSRIRYNHHAFEPDGEELWYDPAIAEYASDDALELGDRLVWNAEVNILPTAVNPLSGFDTFNGPKSNVFPHTKIAMVSVANSMHEPTKFNYTTGTVTQRNYVQRKAGQKASFHHAYGALLVEVDSMGQWWARQINANEDGSFQDLDTVVRDGNLEEGKVAAIIWGDIHVANLDPTVREACWGTGGMIDELAPKYQVFHDLLDFRARNHHDTRNPHLNFQKHLEGTDDVAAEVRKTADFLHEAYRDGVQSVVVPSNHDDALTRWLREADYRDDPKNALFFLRTQTAVYTAIAEGEDDFHVLEWVLQESPSDGVWSAVFLQTDESFVVQDVELGNHGHLGINGARGAPRQFARSGRKAVTGHTHSAGIINGVYTVGTSSRLDAGYNKGPSSWSHTHCVLYSNGKRALVTLRDGKWRAYARPSSS